MLAIKNLARVTTVFPVIAAVVMLAGCTASGPDLLLDGDAALRAGTPRGAVEKIKRATEMLPNEPRAWNLLGVAYHQAGQPKLAQQAYRQALVRDRSNIVSVAHFNLGCLLLEQGDAAAAADELRSYTMLTNSAPAFTRLGTAQLRLRQHDAAERSFGAALRLQPKDAESYNNLGVLNLQRGRARDAAQYFQAALQLNPRHEAALFNTAVLAHQSPGTKPFALQRYREYLALNPRPANWEAVSAVARQLEVELTPPKPAPVTNLAPVAVAPKTNVPAAVPATNPPTLTPTSLIAPVSSVTNTPPVLIKPAATNVVITAPPAPAPVPVPVPVTVPVTVVTLTARPPVLTATAAPPVAVVPVAPRPVIATSAPVLITAPPPAVTVQPGPGKVGKAGKAGKAGFFTRLNPFRSSSTPPALPGPVETGRVVAVSAQASNAIMPVAAVPRPVFPHYTYMNPPRPVAGDRAQAEIAFAKAVKAQRAGNTNEALAQYHLALVSDASFLDAHYNHALLLQAGDARKSLAAWENALAAQPEWADARYHFALALKQSGYPHEAAAQLEKTIEAKPRETRAHLTLANLCAQQLGDTRRARDHYMKVLELDPKNAQASAIRFWLAANP